MTKDDIKKGLEYCGTNPNSCDGCPYDTLFRCFDKLKLDARACIIKQEQEIEQLKEQIEELRNEKWGAQDDLDCYYDEMPSKIKQAKIDVLNELWEKVKDKGVDYKIGMRALSEEIDELIKEQLKK